MRARTLPMAAALAAGALLLAAHWRAPAADLGAPGPPIADDPPRAAPDHPTPQPAPVDPVIQFPEPERGPGALLPPPPSPGSPADRARAAAGPSPQPPVEAAPREPAPAASGPGAAARAQREATQARFSARLSLFVRDRSLDQALGDVAQVAGLRIRVNDRVEDVRIADQRLSGTVREILDRLTAAHNLVWFAERDLVDVSRADTASVRTFRIAGVRDADIRDAIERFGLVNADFAIEVDERNGIARIFAPPRLSARLESIIVGLRPEEAEALGPIEVIRFGLRDRDATN